MEPEDRKGRSRQDLPSQTVKVYRLNGSSGQIYQWLQDVVRRHNTSSALLRAASPEYDYVKVKGLIMGHMDPGLAVTLDKRLTSRNRGVEYSEDDPTGGYEYDRIIDQGDGEEGQRIWRPLPCAVTGISVDRPDGAPVKPQAPTRPMQHTRESMEEYRSDIAIYQFEIKQYREQMDDYENDVARHQLADIARYITKREQPQNETTILRRLKNRSPHEMDSNESQWASAWAIYESRPRGCLLTVREVIDAIGSDVYDHIPGCRGMWNAYVRGTKETFGYRLGGVVSTLDNTERLLDFSTIKIKTAEQIGLYARQADSERVRAPPGKENPREPRGKNRPNARTLSRPCRHCGGDHLDPECPTIRGDGKKPQTKRELGKDPVKDEPGASRPRDLKCSGCGKRGHSVETGDLLEAAPRPGAVQGEGPFR